MTLLATNIRKLRKRNKITQEQLAAHCGVSGAAVSQWESKVSPTVPDLDNLFLISQLLQSTIEQMYFSKNIETESEGDFELDLRVLVRVLAALDQSEGARQFIDKANLVTKASFIKCLYTLYKNMALSDSLSDHELMVFLGLKETDI